MKIVGKNNDISIADELRFVLETKDSNNCLINPYQIKNATIYFITREFTDSTATEYEKQNENLNLKKEYEELKKELCLKYKNNVVAATTENISLFGEQVVDGINVVVGNRILVKNQNNNEENGIYVVSNSSWQRPEDANSKENIIKGMYLFVENGIENINTGWVLESNNFFLKFSTPDQPKESPNNNLKSKLESLKKEIEESKKKSKFYYKDAIAIKTFGGHTDPETGEFFPAWLNPKLVPEELSEKVYLDNLLLPYEENEEIVNGKFILDWKPLDCREGDYFICWSWMPNLAGDVFSDHLFFSLKGSEQLTTSIPTHLTSPKKYEILSERYLPEMFKTIVSNSDITPRVLKGLNNSIAAGFTFIENQANQIIDLLDSNATHEQLLPLLSNMFNLKLKSNDPTLWRRQIKKAIPNFKKKGTIQGLKEAFSDAGVEFISIKKLWQVVSKYTYQESFDYVDSNIFRLSKKIITPLDSNFKIWIRKENSNWVELSQDSESWFDSYVEIIEETNELVWIGPTLSEGDSVRFLYKIRNISESEKSLEEYICSLPLMDERDERLQKYPIKNWNTRVIEEDDDYFNLIVPVRHPLADPIVWGRIRTEFAYSENAYNMEEYNGSKRDSYNPCDIDKDFLDLCNQCQSSKFVIDLEIENLSNESYFEIKKIAEEYMPFHAIAHSFNLSGCVNEFIKPNIENIEALVTFLKEDIMLAGEGQHIFNKSVDRSQFDEIRRNTLSNFSIVENESGTSWSGVLCNRRVMLYPYVLNSTEDLNNPNFREKSQGFSAKNIDITYLDEDPFESSNLLEVIGSDIKNYSLSSFSESSSEINNEIDTSMIGSLFEYRISNKIGDFQVNIEQVNQTIFEDVDADFSMLGIVTQQDVDLGSTSLEPWKLRTQDKLYKINNILPDGTLMLGEYVEASPIVGWQILNKELIVKSSESSGFIKENKYGLIEIEDLEEKKIRIGDYVYIKNEENNKIYKIKSFKKNYLNKFYIENYDEGGAGHENIKVYRRIIENKVGRFGYEGLLFKADQNIESVLSISNGSNKNIENINSELIKENYLLVKDQKYYSIIDINNNELLLNGPLDDWSINGQEVEFNIYKFEKKQLKIKEREIPAVPAFNFDSVDRSGKGLITMTQNNQIYSSLATLNSGSEQVEMVNQNEFIDFEIEYKEEE